MRNPHHMDDRQHVGPAVIGSGQWLCWTPCHKATVRLHHKDLAGLPHAPVVVACPKAGEIWTVSFPDVPAGQERIAVWRR